MSLQIHFLLSILLLILCSSDVLCQTTPRQSIFKTSCAPDYEPCIALSSPKGSLPCCSSDFYCKAHGHYFSQCRPIREAMQHIRRSKPGKKVHLCAKRNGVCRAGAQPDSKIKCCDKDTTCKPSIIDWTCVPNELRWYVLRVGNRIRRAYTDHEWASRYGALVLPIDDKIKIDPAISSNQLRLELPKMKAHEILAMSKQLQKVLNYNGTFAEYNIKSSSATIFVKQGNVSIIASRLAEMSQVAIVKQITL